MKDLGAAQSYLGIRITRDHARQHIWIDQEAYINSTICQIGIEISDHTGDKISVGVTGSSHIGQSVPCDG